ncbi:glycosyltransferase family 2 protein [Tenacibaculum agarivorans]|uniref:glycosyltransferase family 2 protein n=1 Tax=Tenacibaculum agarivorans TaxID=1908389 RepID=UPI00094BA9EF|nr:glycosyltransferase family A protein [Tenacibaculum agarivorans]
MISVLIPTYCWNSFPLVEKLHQQLTSECIPFEIIVIDDASKDQSVLQNKKANDLTYTSFEILSQNIGRSAIRNLLASRAKFPWLLFLDADVMIQSDFIKNYISAIENSNSDVINGGMFYMDDIRKGSLRWKFGKKREEISAIERNNQPFRYVFTANLLIKKKVLDLVKFDEELLSGYGYEDSLFSLDLSKQNITISHIENSIFHLEVDSNKKFIQKVKQGMKNLTRIMKTKDSHLYDIKMLKLYKQNQFILNHLFFLSPIFEKMALKTSSLLFFDAFRITYLAKILRK